MKIKTVLGNRLLVRRAKLVPPDGIFLTETMLGNVEGKIPVFRCEVLAVGTGPLMVRDYPEVKVGTKLLCSNNGGRKQDDGTWIISVLDALAIDESEGELKPERLFAVTPPAQPQLQ